MIVWKMICKLWILCALICPLGMFDAVGTAQVTLPVVLGSHMVVQRELPVHVWGKGIPGQVITVRFRNERQSSKVDDLGRWSIYMGPGAAGGPFEMSIASGDAGQDSIVLTDVFVGDVWVASGQSNMEFPLRQDVNAKEALSSADCSNVRFLVIGHAASDYPLDDVNSDGWKVSNRVTASEVSAVAWYFAREVQQREKVPVGVIQATWGGTPVEAWTSLFAIGDDAASHPIFSAYARTTQRQLDDKAKLSEAERRAREMISLGESAPKLPSITHLESWTPGWLYNAMIAPLTELGIKGVLWYQGEANTDSERAPLYGRIFRDLIVDWRRQWNSGMFPFLFVQIANFTATSDAEWAVVRDGQSKALEIRNTAMVVTVDLGEAENVHPRNKQGVALRLALAARAQAYGEAVEDSGPVFRQAIPAGTSLRLWFEHSSGLTAKEQELTGFEVAGVDGRFVQAIAKIDGQSVMVSSPSVVEPVYVRYGWANNPQCNLYNFAGLPASPFNSMRQ